MSKKNPYMEHYSKLKDLIVYDIVEDQIDGQPVYGIVFRGLQSRGWPADKMRVAWIYRDEEGNGPGFLHIDDVKLNRTRS